MRNTISTIGHLLDALGGDAQIAKNFGVSKSCVSMWRVRNHISNAYHLRLFVQARRKGLNVCPSVFGLEAKDLDFIYQNTSCEVEIQHNAA